MEPLQFIELVALVGFVDKSFRIPCTDLFVDRGNSSALQIDGIPNIYSNINEQEQKRDDRHPDFLVLNNYLLPSWQCI
jgi:hypothetical protein